MKSLFLLIAAVFLATTSLSSVHALTSNEQNIIDRVVTRWHARQPASVLAARTQAILDRIDNLQQRARLTPEASALLNYVEIRLTNILNALENKPLISTSGNGTTVTTPTSSTFPSILTIPERFDTNPLVIAGTTSPLFWEIRYSIGTEPMIITDLNLQASRDNVNNRVREFALYDDTGRFVASTISDGRSISFDALDLRREIGSHTFYIALLPYSVDDLYSVSPVTFTLSLQNLYAEGVYSRNEISPSIQTNTSPTITISPVGVATVQFLDTWNGYRTDTYLSPSQTTLGIVEITTPSVQSRFEQNIVLDTLKVRVSDSTVARQVANNLRIERIDNQSSSSIQGTVQGNTVTFSLSSLGNNTLEQGQNAVFRVTAGAPLDSYSRESAQISIGDLKNGGLTYHLEGNNELITTVQQWSWEVFGPIISD